MIVEESFLLAGVLGDVEYLNERFPKRGVEGDADVGVAKGLVNANLEVNG